PEAEYFLYRYDVLFHADDLGDGNKAPAAIFHALDLDHDIDGRSNLRADGPRRDVQSRHTDHLFYARQCVARCIGMYCSHGAVVTRVHGLQHVECFPGADLAHDDAVRPHAQCIAHKVTLRDLAPALDVGRPCLQAANMRLL